MGSCIRGHKRFVLIAGVISLCAIENSYAAGNDFLDCLQRALSKSPSPRAEMLKDKVEVIFYPKAGGIIFPHTELSVDGVFWNARKEYKPGATNAVAERAARAGSKGFFRFKLAVTEDELNSLRGFLKEREGKQIPFQFCASGACKAITQNTGIVIPLPFSKSPALSAAYLTAVQKLGYSRVVKIEYVGKNAFRNLLTPGVIGEALHGYDVYVVGGLIITGVNELGQLVQDAVPLQETSK